MTTKEAVTMSGWYENTDGTVSLYRWRGSELVLVKTVETWAHATQADMSNDSYGADRDAKLARPE